MGKKVYFTQKQLEECMLQEITLSGDEQLAATKDPKSAAQKTIDNAQSQGVDTNNGAAVSFSADSLRRDAGISESKTYTKKQLKEARLKWLRENSVAIKKKDLFKKKK